MAAAQIITAAAAKGGTGKTATIGALAFAAAGQRKKVLVVDTDPQANISIWLDADFGGPNAFDVIEEGRPAAEAVQITKSGIALIAGHGNLADLSTKANSARRLEAALQPLRRNYDVILIDTAAAMNENLNNALFAATGLLITLFADALSLQAFYQTADILTHIRESKRIKAGIVLTHYDKRTRFNRHMKALIEENAAEIKAPIYGTIRRSIAVWEAIGMRENLFKYAPKCNPAADYMALYKNLEAAQWI